MPKIRVMTWNICGDAQARADTALHVITTEKPHIIFFQEARKTKPDTSNLATTLSNIGTYDLLFQGEYGDPVAFGGQMWYPDTKSKAYYCFFNKNKLSRKMSGGGNLSTLKLVKYAGYLAPKDPRVGLLTTRPPAYIKLIHNSSGTEILLFTWHAPLSGAGGGVFNPAAHAFFGTIADQMAAGKVAVIAGDMNATSKQVAKSYSNAWEAAGSGLDHIMTNQTLSNAAYYDDVKSDVHYLFLADISWN